MIRMIEETEGYRKRVEMISEGRDEEYRMQCFKAELHEKSGLDEDQMKGLECGIRWAVEARRKGRGEEQEQRRRGEQEQRRQDEQGQNTEQEQSKQGKQVEEEQLEETRAENSGEPEVTGRTTEVRTGRGSAGIVRGRDERRRADETSKKGKGKGNGGKGEHERRGRERRNGSEWRQTWGPVAHTPQAMSDPGEGEMTEGEQQRNEEKEEILKLLRGWQERETSPVVRWAWADESTEEESNQEEEEEKKETRDMRWADCEESEGKEKEEQEAKEERPEQSESKKEQEQEGEKEGARQEELMNEKPPGLEHREESK